jgi:hypothetical protein
MPNGRRAQPTLATLPGRPFSVRPVLVIAAASPATGGAVALAILTLLGPSVASARAAGHPPTSAHAARALNVTDTAHLRYRGTAGSSLIEEGPASGGLPGTVKVRFDVGASVSATFTISTRNGSLIGHGSGALHSSGMYASFGGSMTITRGTGHYRYARGHGGFYGVINRKSYDLTVQTTGKLSY